MEVIANTYYHLSRPSLNCLAGAGQVQRHRSVQILAHNLGYAILARAIDRSFDSFGKSVKATIIWHLKINGFSLEQETINFAVFYETLSLILGHGADRVLDSIYKDLSLSARPTFIKSNWSSLKKIEAILSDTGVSA